MSDRRFVVLLHDDETGWENATEAQRADVIRLHDEFEDAARAAGCRVVGGEPLRAAATGTVFRRRGTSEVLTDGPFAETVEQLGGFYVLEAPDLDAVVAAVRHLPEYTIEIRPVADL